MAAPTRRTPPRWVPWTLAGGAALLVCLVFGIMTASANLSLGPNQAHYEVTTTSNVVVDLGPLGTLQIDSPVKPLGVDVVIKEIPANLTEVSQATTLTGLSQDLNSYLQFFNTPQVTIAEVARALVVDAIRRTLIAVVVVGLVGAGVWFLLGAVRRRELAERLKPRTWGITAGVAAAALVAGCVASDDVGTAPALPTSPVFAGTALAGARITGRLAGVIDTYGEQLLGIYRQNEKFYAEARTNLQAAWAKQAGLDKLAVSRGTAGLPTEPAPTPTASPEPSATPPQHPGETSPVTFLVISDLHCNMSMTPLIRDIAERSGTDVILDGGDTTMNGTAVEKVCVDSFAKARPKGVPMVVADGNHDSALISDAERAQGIKVLDGKVIDVDGVKILGDRDPNETRVGEGTSSRGESAAQTADRLARTACDAGDVDLLLIHDPAVGNASMASGCVPFQVSGHTHTRYDPVVRGQGVRYVNASTAGAKSGQPTVGPLHGTAEMTLLRFDPVTRTFTDWKLVEVFPDKTAKVGPWQVIPPRPEPVHVELPSETPTGTPASPSTDPSQP